MMEYIDKEKLEYAIYFMKKLSKGTDPISNFHLDEDTVLNNREYKIQFTYIIQALVYLQENIPHQRSYNTKPIFNLTGDQIQQIQVSSEPISVSKMTYIINSVVDTNNMKKLKATQITEWLTQQGYLQKDKEGISSHRLCTEKAKELGIFSVEKVNDSGNKYLVNLYHGSAQRFIIDNINEIAQS